MMFDAVLHRLLYCADNSAFFARKDWDKGCMIYKHMNRIMFAHVYGRAPVVYKVSQADIFANDWEELKIE